MSNPPGWCVHSKLSAQSGVIAAMAGVSVQAGVVTDAQVNGGMPKQPSRFVASLSDPSTWSYIWVAASFAYLVGIYLGMITIRRRGA